MEYVKPYMEITCFQSHNVVRASLKDGTETEADKNDQEDF